MNLHTAGHILSYNINLSLLTINNHIDNIQ